MLFEPNDEPRRSTHSKAFERLVGLAVILGVAGLVILISYVIDL